MDFDKMDRFIYELERAFEPEPLPFEDLVLKMSKMTEDKRVEFMDTLDGKTLEKINEMIEGGLL
jgi:hypothetical protein